MITKIDAYKEKQEELDEDKKSILKLIDEFILYSDEFRRSHSIYNYINSSDFYFTDTLMHPIVVNYNIKYNDRIISQESSFTREELTELGSFMEDPEIYKSLKKYNL